MNEELLRALPSAADMRKELHEAIWLRVAEAGVGARDSSSGAIHQADKVLEAFKLRFETPTGVSH